MAIFRKSISKVLVKDFGRMKTDSDEFVESFDGEVFLTWEGPGERNARFRRMIYGV